MTPDERADEPTRKGTIPDVSSAAIGAAKSSAEAGVATQEACVFTVCDSGPGVPPQERALIFERFQRGRQTGGDAGFEFQSHPMFWAPFVLAGEGGAATAASPHTTPA